MKNFDKVLYDFSRTKRANFLNVGKYSEFVTAIQEPFYYQGTQVYLDIYRKNGKLLLVRSSYARNTVFDARLIENENDFHVEMECYNGFNHHYDNSINTILVTKDIVRHYTTALEYKRKVSETLARTKSA